jgi:hypothetical protein
LGAGFVRFNQLIYIIDQGGFWEPFYFSANDFPQVLIMDSVLSFYALIISRRLKSCHLFWEKKVVYTESGHEMINDSSAGHI